ncbi:hypothetical protein LR48_Vigan07g198600 [Vigna angularis]|uniref:Uncharacterized protein n=1 Tax=Phaseolus angularis TaxID=3914 RepID=A0A0L9V090_PHAAN|nr:hypothetical protein LR48_Vigan07g198600 [Vigna angularis]
MLPRVQIPPLTYQTVQMMPPSSSTFSNRTLAVTTFPPHHSVTGQPLSCRRHHHVATSVHLLSSRNQIAPPSPCRREAAATSTFIAPLTETPPQRLSFIDASFFHSHRHLHLLHSRNPIATSPRGTPCRLLRNHLHHAVPSFSRGHHWVNLSTIDASPPSSVTTSPQPCTASKATVEVSTHQTITGSATKKSRLRCLRSHHRLRVSTCTQKNQIHRRRVRTNSNSSAGRGTRAHFPQSETLILGGKGADTCQSPIDYEKLVKQN